MIGERGRLRKRKANEPQKLKINKLALICGETNVNWILYFKDDPLRIQYTVAKESNYVQSIKKEEWSLYSLEEDELDSDAEIEQ